MIWSTKIGFFLKIGYSSEGNCTGLNAIYGMMNYFKEEM